MKLIIITGTPGVGKTDTSKILARELNAVHIDLNKKVMNGKLTTKYDLKRKCYVADFDKISNRIKKEVEKFSGRTVILEGHYAVLVAEPKKIDSVFVLRCNPEELEDRLKDRGYPQKKIAENVLAEILGVCVNDAIDVCGMEKVYQINITRKNAGEIISEILEFLNAKRKKSENIDWISEMERNGKIEKIIGYERQLLNNF